MIFDLLIKNGYLINGTGNPWFRADIGVKDGKIKSIKRKISERARKIIDAKSLVVSPGFIDVHAHDDLVFFDDPFDKPKLKQGVTTVVCGNCGISPAPLNKKTLDYLKSYVSSLGRKVDFTWSRYGEFLDELKKIEIGINVAGMVGHGTLRIAVMGMKNIAPTKEELAKMKKLLAQSLEEGAIGMSTGLIYPPGEYAKTEELIELCKILTEYGGIYTTHLRNEGDRLLEAIDEAIRIAKESGVPIELSHHKVTGRKNWGLVLYSLEKIRNVKEKGIDITVDAYPYSASNTSLNALVPPWVLAGGEQHFLERLKDKKTRKMIKKEIEEKTDWDNSIKGSGWDNIVLSFSPKYKQFEGKTLRKISEIWNKDPYDALFDILLVETSEALVNIFEMDDKDMERVITCPYVSIVTDALPDIEVDRPHPRGYGSFPRVLGRYVRDRGLITIEEAVRKMTSLPAQTFGFEKKGLLKEDFDADIIIFDPKSIIDRATYDNPKQFPEGLKCVIVNGQIAIEKGAITGIKSGKVIRKK